MMVEPDRRQRIARLTPLADVLARLDALVRPVAPRTVELAAAVGQTLAEDVIIHAPVPATPLALRDGWAVSSDLTTDASAYAPAPLPSAVWVDVGQPLPGDADAVAPIDGVVIRDGAAQALAPVGPGAGAFPTGADVARRATLLPLASSGELLVHGIGLLPGETTAVGTVGTRPVLALPGRLDAALAAWHMLGRVMLARLAGSRDAPPMRTAKLTHKVSSPVGLSELVPVRCEGPCATPIASGYVPLAALAQANGWIFIKPDSEGYPPQSQPVVTPWP